MIELINNGKCENSSPSFVPHLTVLFYHSLRLIPDY